ncbi:MAG TPA: winged helix-turn-helix domain-containing protein [Gemmatimonadales bacterium]|nr:winged helix-turn-helix domain-containing protein [Gemmatimonadales bacterium]
MDTAALSLHDLPEPDALEPVALQRASLALVDFGSERDLAGVVTRLEEALRLLRTRIDGSREVCRFGQVEVEFPTQTIRRSGRRVAVTRTEFRILYALIRRAGEIVAREHLIREVWGPEARLRSRAVDTHVARLRRKLEEDPASPRHIHTAPYQGYRFDPRGGRLGA